MEPAIETQRTPVESPEEPRVNSVPAAGGERWWRLAYAIEFLLAITAATILWSEVGGQVHLDMMPWYLKLAALLALAWSAVRFTMALVNDPAPWNRIALRWLVAMILIAGAMFAITMYYHLHEPADDSDEDEGLSTSTIQFSAAGHWRGGLS